MELYDKLIEGIKTGAASSVKYSYKPEEACKKSDPGTIILSKETAFEFGGTALAAIGSVMFCNDPEIDDSVVVCGKDIDEISSDTAYARFAVISLCEEPDEDDSELYSKLKSIELEKYHIYPEGCLLRLSPESKREQLRVGKKAKEKGLSLKNVGFSFISEYKKNPLVRAVRIYFFTGSGHDYKALGSLSDKASAVTESLNKILNGLEISCDTCELRPICDEVEGLRKLHFGKES